MLRCKVCNKVLSDYAKSCPGCGDPDPVYAKSLMLSKIFIGGNAVGAMLVFFVAILLSFCLIDAILSTSSNWIKLAVSALPVLGYFAYFVSRHGFLSARRWDLGPWPEWVKGRHHFQEGYYKESIVALNRAIELDARFEIAYLWRGNAYYNDGQFDNAVVDYNRTIELAPKQLQVT